MHKYNYLKLFFLSMIKFSLKKVNLKSKSTNNESGIIILKDCCNLVSILNFER